MPDISLTLVPKSDGTFTVEPRLNVIFVHGLGGDPVTTWCHKGGADGGYFWAKGIAEEIEGAAVYTLSYPAAMSVLGSGWPIAEAAGAVLDRMVADGGLQASPETPIAFVCHSNGGLIVKKLMLTAHIDREQNPRKGRFLDNIAGVAFLATPHGGSRVAAWLSRLFPHLASDTMHGLRMNAAELRDIAVSYRTLFGGNGGRVRHKIFYETRRVLWLIKPVEAYSADPGLDERPVATDRNHSTICKPKTRQDQVHVGMLDFLRNVVLQPREPSLIAKVDAQGATLAKIAAAHEPAKLRLAPKQEQLASDLTRIAPTQLLQARFGAVGYSDITGMRDDLLAWCTSEDRSCAGRLIHGPGGMGKTRLLIEVAANLRSQGWAAGFLDPSADMSEAALGRLIAHGDDKGLLIVLDYAESRQREVRQLAAAILADGANAARPIRLVLLTRGAGEWWQMLCDEDEQAQVKRLFHRTGGETDVIALPAIATGADRLAFYNHCGEAFAKILRAQGHALPQAPLPAARLQRIADGDSYKRPLTIQMEALLYLTSATPDAPGIDKQLEAVLGVERAHWKKLLGALSDEAKRDMNRGIAQVTAVQGVPDRASAGRLLMADGFYKRTAPVDVDAIYHSLATVYGRGAGGIAHLEPDIIGEHQVAAFGDADLIGGCFAWIASEPLATREERFGALITVLQRATHPDHGAAVSGKAKALLAHLTAQVEGLDDDDTLAALDGALPEKSVALMDVAFAVAKRRAGLARRRLVAADATAERDEAAEHLAARVGTLGIRLSALGRREEALAASSEAVDIRRRLAETRPDAFLPDLAMSLNNLGIRLSALGRREEALAASSEAVDIYRRLAETRPDAFLPDLASSLNNLGGDLSALGRREEALAASSEAVDIYRRLAETRPDAFLPDLAMSLNNLGGDLSALGRREEALAASSEAVDIYRRLAETRPDAFLPDLAMSLNNTGAMLSALGRREEALAASSEAVDIYRRLAETRPDAFLPDLASSLNNLGIRLSALGRREEALAASSEAVDIYRRLAETRPDAFLPDLAMSLNNTGAMLSALGRREEALAASSEAVDIYRRLAETRPDAFLPDLASSLDNLGIRLSALGRREEALAASSEAVDIYRRLAETRPDAFLPDLAMSLGARAQVFAGCERHAEAAASASEGLVVLTPFVASHPKAFGDLAGALARDYVSACQSAGQEPDAALLEPIARALGMGDGDDAPDAIPDETVRAMMAEPQFQEVLTAFIRENNLEGTPADLPIETQRALAAAISAAMRQAGADGDAGAA